jgi:hypothetical protein
MTTQTCNICGKPFSSRYSVQKYCGALCSAEANRRKTRTAYHANPAVKLALNSARRAKYSMTEQKCSCCGLMPVGRGLRFLCDRCYDADGDDWMGGYGEHDSKQAGGQGVSIAYCQDARR